VGEGNGSIKDFLKKRDIGKDDFSGNIAGKKEKKKKKGGQFTSKGIRRWKGENMGREGKEPFLS